VVHINSGCCICRSNNPHARGDAAVGVAFCRHMLCNCLLETPSDSVRVVDMVDKGWGMARSADYTVRMRYIRLRCGGGAALHWWLHRQVLFSSTIVSVRVCWGLSARLKCSDCLVRDNPSSGGIRLRSMFNVALTLYTLLQHLHALTMLPLRRRCW